MSREMKKQLKEIKMRMSNYTWKWSIKKEYGKENKMSGENKRKLENQQKVNCIK